MRAQAWDAELSRHAAFVRPHLPLLWGQKGGSPGARQQVRAEQAREIPGVMFASVNFKQLLV